MLSSLVFELKLGSAPLKNWFPTTGLADLKKNMSYLLWLEDSMRFALGGLPTRPRGCWVCPRDGKALATSKCPRGQGQTVQQRGLDHLEHFPAQPKPTEQPRRCLGTCPRVVVLNILMSVGTTERVAEM